MLQIYTHFIAAQADIEFSSRLAARGMSDTEISAVEKPSTILTSLENYVKNGIKRYGIIEFLAYLLTKLQPSNNINKDPMSS